MPALKDLKVKIFADGADLAGIRAMAAKAWIAGFTTNPTLMRKAGVADYKAFALDVLGIERRRSVSFEVFADEFSEMVRQGQEIASWGSNVYVKIPVSTTRGEFTGPVISELSRAGVKLNITAVFTLDQVRRVTAALAGNAPAIVSVFAGRVADTGLDPVPVMQSALRITAARSRTELLWASPRELLNIVQADEIGCDIITVTNDLLGKLELLGKNNEEYSLETVRMFHRDAQSAGFEIRCGAAPVAAAP
jgi:transaldolase